MDGDPCGCVDGAECWFYEPGSDSGYPWCRPCGEHHRSPECPIDAAGNPLAPCGCTWAETDQPGYYDQPCRHQLAREAAELATG